MPAASKQPSLGTVLDDARKAVGMSVRQLADSSEVPKSAVDRLLRDQVESPVPDFVARMAAVLELNAADLFLLAGLAMPTELPSVEALLRTNYDLPEDAVQEAKAQIDKIVSRYKTKSTNPKGGKK
jgi:transcriptional regulator with XRE-family HTH domain